MNFWFWCFPFPTHICCAVHTECISVFTFLRFVQFSFPFSWFGVFLVWGIYKPNSLFTRRSIDFFHFPMSSWKRTARGSPISNIQFKCILSHIVFRLLNVDLSVICLLMMDMFGSCSHILDCLVVQLIHRMLNWRALY